MSYHRSMDPSLPKPEWLMIGVQWDEGVVIIASQELSTAELSRIEVQFDPFDTRSIMTTSAGYEVNGRMASFIMAKGIDYRDALARLLQHWNPPVQQKVHNPAPSVQPAAPGGLPRAR